MSFEQSGNDLLQNGIKFEYITETIMIYKNIAEN